jgi:transposase
MPIVQRHFTRHIRDEAVRLAVTSGRARREIAEDLGSSTLRHWIDRRWECGSSSRPGTVRRMWQRS